MQEYSLLRMVDEIEVECHIICSFNLSRVAKDNWGEWIAAALEVETSKLITFQGAILPYTSMI